jgi:protein SCO1/2
MPNDSMPAPSLKPNRPRRARRWAAAAAIAALWLGQAACSPGDGGAGTDGFRGVRLPEPRPKPDFTLQDTDGRPFRFREETDGYVTLLFFGYTNCPDVCPVHMASIAAVLDDFPFELRRQLKVVFVTTDPRRDTPERLRGWLDRFDPSFVGLRGDEAQVNEIMSKLGLPAAVKSAAGDGEYLVGHSAQVLAFTKDGLAHLVYPFGTRQADWAHDLPKLARAAFGADAP